MVSTSASTAASVLKMGRSAHGGRGLLAPTARRLIRSRSASARSSACRCSAAVARTYGCGLMVIADSFAHLLVCLDYQKRLADDIAAAGDAGLGAHLDDVTAAGDAGFGTQRDLVAQTTHVAASPCNQ